MQSRIRTNLPAIAAPVLGMVLGYLLLYFPVIRIPIEPGFYFILPFLKRLEAVFLASEIPISYIRAIASFLLELPNTLAVSVLAALVMYVLQRPRLVFYSTLVWPALMHLRYWGEVFLLKRGAERLGLPAGIENLPVDYSFPARSAWLLLMYLLFSFVVFLTWRVLLARRRSCRTNKIAGPSESSDCT